jgi:hypothetical protein
VLKAIDAGAELRSIEVVGPQVGDELKGKAVQALAAALLLIFLYIAVRFHTWRLSLGAILAVLHDPILVLGVFSVTQTPFDLNVVGAMLAVIGHRSTTPSSSSTASASASSRAGGWRRSSRWTSRSTRRCRGRS